MKNKNFLFTLMLTLMMPWAAVAQFNATVNEGSVSNNGVPFYGLFADWGCKGQFIIPASDLANIGVTSGCQISKLKFYGNSNEQTWFGVSCIVEVGEVAYSTFGSATLETSGLTTVFSGTSLTSDSDGGLEVIFSSNYTYNGGNLLVSVGGYGNKASDKNWYGVYRTGAAVRANNTSNSQSIPTSAQLVVDFAPKTTITFSPTDPFILLNPSSATLPTGNTLTLTATVGNVNGTPNITYMSGNTNTATVSGNGTTATVTAVSEGTVLITAEMSYEGTNYSATSTITVLDACQPTWTGGGNTSHYISNLAVSSSGTTLLDNTSLGTPLATTNYYDTQSLTAMAGDELSCVISMSSTGTYGFALWVDFDGDGFEAEDKMFGTSSYSNAPYTGTFTIPVNTPPGEYRLRILGDYFTGSPSDPCGTYGNGEAEDYKLIVTTCFPPTGLTVAQTSTGFHFEWDAEPGMTFAYSWGLAGHEHGGSFATGNSGHDNFVDLPLPGLQFEPNTDYVFYVFKTRTADYWSDDATIGFHTPCDAIAIPWSENFDSYTGSTNNVQPSNYPDDELPSCWQFLNRSESKNQFPQVFISSYSGYPVSGKCLFFKSCRTPLYAILPAFEEEIAGLQLTFTYRNQGTDDRDGTLIVGYMTDPSDAATFTEVLTCEKTETLTEKRVLFPNAPAVSYMAFKYVSSTNNVYYLSIDDVEVTVAPCLEPTALTASDITSTTANLSWTGDQVSYNLRYRAVTVNGIVENFEDPATLDSWQQISNNSVNTDPENPDVIYGSFSEMHHGGGFCYAFCSFNQADDYNQYLVSPELTTEDWLSFYYIGYQEAYPESFRVGFSSGSNDVTSGDWTWTPNVFTDQGYSDNWTNYSVAIPAGTKYVAINYTSEWMNYLFIDDIVISNSAEWTTVENVANPFTLNGLTSNTEYEWQVQGICGNVETDWVAGPNFTTKVAVLLSAGINWWSPTTEMTLAELEAALGTNGLVINSQYDGFVRYDNGTGTWNGTLTTLYAGQMYKIETSAACSFTPSGDPITFAYNIFEPGYTWFGIIGTAPMSVGEVFSVFSANPGDTILSENGIVVTTYNDGWSAASLQPGRGYIYHYTGNEPHLIWWLDR